MPKWEKSPEALVRLLERVLPEGSNIERRTMFGYPCAFVNGNMFAGLFGKQMFVRLPAEERPSLMADQEAKPLEPMPGRPMKDYIVVPPALLTSERDLRALVARAMAFGASLAPKIKKAGGKRSSAGTRAPGALPPTRSAASSLADKKKAE
jgi:TfoX/Sxy family transcriptional regulator of competence genes